MATLNVIHIHNLKKQEILNFHMTELKRKEYILSELTTKIFAEAETYYNKHGKFSEELLLALHSIYGAVLERATEFLDTNRVVEYKSRDQMRKLYMVGNTRGQVVLFDRINFCPCHAFKCQVLDAQDLITCKHVLALKLAQITKQMKSEVVTESQFIELLNNQVSTVCDADCFVNN